VSPLRFATALQDRGVFAQRALANLPDQQNIFHASGLPVEA